MAIKFYNLVFTITVVISILVLAVMGIMLLVGKKEDTWPPDVSECPDYWTVNQDGSCKSQPSVGNTGTGTASCSTFDPTTCGGQGGACLYSDLEASNNTSGALAPGGPRCRRQAWAKACGVYWDGISDISAMYCTQSGSTDPGGNNGGGSCDCAKCTAGN